jgi:hypothetical protein
MTGRQGFALVVALLMTMALAMVGVGMLTIAAHEAELSSAMLQRSRARRGAEAAVRAAVAGWSTRMNGELAVGEVAPAGGVKPDVGSARVRRLAVDLFLLESTVRSSASAVSASATAAALVRTLDHGAAANGFRAAASGESAARVKHGVISGADACGGDAVTGIAAPNIVIDPHAAVAGAPAVELVALHALEPPEIWTPPLIERLASITLQGGTASPVPSSDSNGCVPGSMNWGAITPLGPCHALLPLVYSLGDLVVRDGEGRGFLVVEGDLHLERFRFHGLLLVRGTLTIGSGSAIRGAVRADTLEMLDGTIAYDACAVGDALTADGLDGPFRLGDRWWVPTFGP